MDPRKTTSVRTLGTVRGEVEQLPGARVNSWATSMVPKAQLTHRLTEIKTMIVFVLSH